MIRNMSALQTDRPLFHAPRLLIALLIVVITMLAGLVLVPGLASFAPSAAIQKPKVVIDYASIKPGDYRVYESSDHVTIAVYRRTPQQTIARGATSAKRYSANPDDLILPSGIDAVSRSHNPEYFVFYPIDTRYGCNLRFFPTGDKANLPGWEGGFSDGCVWDYAYDFAGWSLERRSNDYAYVHWLPSRNLFIPKHEFKDGKLVVYPWPADLNKVGPIY